MPDQARHVGLEKLAKLTPGGSETEGSRLRPREGTQTREARHRPAGDAQAAGRAPAAAPAQHSARLHVDVNGVDARSPRGGRSPRTDRTEADARACRCSARRRQPRQRAGEPPRARLSSARTSSPYRAGWRRARREPGHDLHDPGRLAQPPEVFAQRGERMRHVEVVDADQLAPPGVEEHQLAEREQLERAAEARLQSPARARATPRTRPKSREKKLTTRSLSPSGKLPMTTAAERPRPMPGGQPEAELAQRAVVLPPVVAHLHAELSRNTGIPKNASSSRRAALPIRLSMAPPLPITMPFCDSCSTKIVARM